MALTRGPTNQERLGSFMASTGLSTTTGQLVGAAALLYSVTVANEDVAGTSARAIFTDQTAAGAVTGNADTVLSVLITTGDTSRTKKVDFSPPLFLSNNLRVSVIGTALIHAQYNPLS